MFVQPARKGTRHAWPRVGISSYSSAQTLSPALRSCMVEPDQAAPSHPWFSCPFVHSQQGSCEDQLHATVHVRGAYLSASFRMCQLCAFCHFLGFFYKLCSDVQTCHHIGWGGVGVYFLKSEKRPFQKCMGWVGGVGSQFSAQSCTLDGAQTCTTQFHDVYSESLSSFALPFSGRAGTQMGQTSCSSPHPRQCKWPKTPAVKPLWGILFVPKTGLQKR